MPVQERHEPRHPEAERSPVPKSVVTFFAALRKTFGKAEESRAVVHEHPTTVAHSGTWNLHVSVTADELDGGFVAECLDMPGAMSQGETEEDALENLIDAVQGVVAVRMEEHFRTINFAMQPTDATRTGRDVNITF